MCFIPVTIDNFHQTVKKHRFGRMNVECNYCGALRFSKESPNRCCSKGKVKLKPLEMPPELATLANNKKFRRHARGYNQAFAISTIGGIKQDRSVNNGGTQTYRVCGKAYHRYGSLCPKEGSPPIHAQMYFYSGDEQDNLRKGVLNNLSKDILKQLRKILEGYNPYVKKFAYVAQHHDPGLQYKLVFHHFDDKVYNSPSASEVGAIQEMASAHHKLDVVLKSKYEKKLSYVNDLSSCYDSIQYLLIHPYGQQGWHRKLNMTCRQFYAFFAFTRSVNFHTNPLTHLGPLVQQYWVDMGMKYERLKLNYITLNKSKFRIADGPTIEKASDRGNDVTGIKLPSSVTGCPRYMYEKFKDTLKTCEKYGGPHVFLTITCNPQWGEIVNELLPGQSPFERPELLVRVFKLKLEEIVQDIFTENLFGVPVFRVHVIEFQKRMLPHAHLAIGLKEGQPLSKYDREAIDRHIYAEIPNKDTQPELFHSVTKHNLHYPCHIFKNCSCIKPNGHCKSSFLKPFNKHTQKDEEGWVTYRRRSPEDGGNVAVKKYRGKTITFTNQSVVPYNPYLTLKYDCHINAEYVNSIHPVKYLFVYFYKVKYTAYGTYQHLILDIRDLPWLQRLLLTRMMKYRSTYLDVL